MRKLRGAPSSNPCFHWPFAEIPDAVAQQGAHAAGSIVECCATAQSRPPEKVISVERHCVRCEGPHPRRPDLNSSSSGDLVQGNIDRFGCHVIHVLPTAQNPHLRWAYTVGIERSGAPDCIVIGLEHQLAHSIVNDYCVRVRGGEPFPPLARKAGFLAGFDCEVREVLQRHYDGYVGQALRYYGGPTFRLIQIVYPTTDGIWPWDDDDSSSWQPLLDR